MKTKTKYPRLTREMLNKACEVYDRDGSAICYANRMSDALSAVMKLARAQVRARTNPRGETK